MIAKDAAGRWTLTVELGIEGGMLTRTLHAEYKHERLDGPRLDEVGASYVVDHRRGLAALRHVLTAGDKETIGANFDGQQLVRAGEAMFEVLFGAGGNADSTALCKVLGEECRVPTRHPVRVRIVTSAEELIGLPWGIAAWRGSFLRDYGWIFEVTGTLIAAGNERLKLPTSVLAILPELLEPGDETGSRAHLEDIQEVLDTYLRGISKRPDRFAVARTREEVVRTLTELKPSILYFYGHGADGPEPGLKVPAERTEVGARRGAWRGRDVARAIRESGAPVLVAYLNGCMTGRGGWGSVAHQLRGDVPVVLAHPTSTWGTGARTTAKRWFRQLLGAEQDPVSAAFHRDIHEPMTGLGWLPLLSYTRHATFHVERDQSDFRRLPEGIDLDRHLQREQANSQVRQLALRSERRVQGFIALGPPNNHPEDVAKQLHRFIEDLDPRLDLHISDPLDVSASLVRGEAEKEGFLAEMTNRLCGSLGAEWGVDLRKALEDRAPPRTPKRYRILWLDWRVLRGLPVKDDVTGWMRFCSGPLVAALPEGFDVVITIAIEVPAPKLESIQKVLDRLVNKPPHRRDKIRFTVLPQLGPAPLGEVLQFLDDAHCPEGLRGELAELLLAASGGDYALLRQQIDRGLPDRWGELARELRGSSGGPDSEAGL